MKNLNEWTRKEFEALPNRGWNEDIGRFDALVILPTKSKHDCGYSDMDFVAVKAGRPLCKLSGCSDVLHLREAANGGQNSRDWSIDCLHKSKLLRLFPRGAMTAGLALSSFEVFAD